MDGVSGSYYEIDFFSKIDAGLYYSRISNPAAPLLTLESNTITVTLVLIDSNFD